MDGKKAVVEMVSSWVPNPKVSLCDVDGGGGGGRNGSKHRGVRN